ncbi:transcriptional regulator LysR family [Vibrio astriarenae]|nr:transcriptional regulator LysR family [Vibrio sp. C7]
MRYSLKQLAVFDAVAELGSVSQAAERLAVTQSAASMSLSQLEKLLGRDLFIRQGKDMRLSHWGNWLRPRLSVSYKMPSRLRSDFTTNICLVATSR